MVSQDQLSDLEKRYREGGIGYKESKEILAENIIKLVTPMRERRKEFENNSARVAEILKAGGDLMAYATEVGKGNVLWPLRYALSGQEVSPDPFTLVSILGKDESVKRIDKAIKELK